MNSTRAITTLFSILLLLAGAAWFFLTNTPQIKLITPEHIREHRFTALEVQQFDKTGVIAYHLTSPNTYHMPSEDTHHLNTPHILVTKTNQPAWTIQSEEALVTPKAHEIKLLKHVRAHHSAYQKQAAGVFKTDAISYFPKKKWLETPHDITWDQADNHLEATGMQANLITQHVELLKNIKGTYKQLEDTSYLHASRVTTKMNKKNKLTRAAAFGVANQKAHFWTTAAVDKSPLHAYADTIYYHPLKNQLELIGHAEIMQGKNQLTAPHILYDTKAKQLITTAENNQNTVILINPAEHPEKHL
ncbi:MAG: LPS export ABC transporter periplasmic protein LptC [Legionella sp.]|nr:LPS export ABC transporter periplasmic protein LptC [Legionella sp.]